jgi:hypothetical protein
MVVAGGKQVLFVGLLTGLIVSIAALSRACNECDAAGAPLTVRHAAIPSNSPVDRG